MRSHLKKIGIFLTYWIFFINFFFFIFMAFFDSTLIFDSIILISTTITFFFLAIGKIKQLLTKEDFVNLIILSIALCLCFQSLILNIDRSRSFYALSWVSQGKVLVKSDGGFDLRGVMSSESTNLEAINQRLVEQESRGLIEISNDEVRLTKVGIVLFVFAEKIADIYDLQGWNQNRK